MKKVFKITFSFLMIFVLIASFFSMNTAAASATTHFSPSKSEYAIGEQITVTIKVNVGVETYSIDGSLSYDSSIVQYVSGGANQGSSVKIVEAFSGEKEVSASVVFKTIAAGKCNFSFSGFCVDNNLQQHNATTGYFINVKNHTPELPPTTSSTPSTPTPSTNANLSSLKVSGATLSPKFNSNTTSYTATVPFTTDKVTISAGVADKDATFTGAGTFNLEIGDNSKTITVTAASGAKKSYKIVIKRLAEDQGEPQAPTDTLDPLLISAEGISRKIMQDISSMPVPKSFTPSTAQVGDITVGTLTEFGGRYILYYTTLEDGSDAALYYKDDNAEYRRLRYLELNGKFYIIEDLPEGRTPNGWYKDVMSVTAGSVTAYRSEASEMKDFYVLYCYTDGVYGFYRFDSLYSTIQRAPDFNLDRPVSNEQQVTLPKKESIFKRFANMNPTGKAVIILIGLAIICIAALVVLLILRLTGVNKPTDGDGLFLTDDEDSNESTNEESAEFEIEETEEKPEQDW